MTGFNSKRDAAADKVQNPVNKDEALKLALEALEDYKYAEARTIIREALAQPAQEPVAVVSGYYGGKCVILPIDRALVFNPNTVLYTTPPQRKPLTDEEIAYATAPVLMGGNPSLTGIARAIEAAHGIKGDA